jgi:4-amino-4-deoxy-L-arabinose transferase-like glycosyltransferase
MRAERPVREILALLALCAALFFVGLGSYDLDTKGEPREAFTAWEMIHSGEWALPHLNGEALPEKPLVFAPRLPSALAACGVVLVVFALGRRLQGEGFRPALVTATMTLVVMLARRARVDMTLTFFVCFALLQCLRTLERPTVARAALLGLALALGTLTKGPIGTILPALAIGTFLLATGRLRAARGLLPALPVLVVVAGAWYANGLLREGKAFFQHTFMMENLLMYLGHEEGGGHVHGTLYYLKYLPWQTVPWTLYVPPALWLAWQRRREPRAAFPLAWLVSLFVFFSIGRGKRGDYMLPLMPPIALLVAELWRGDSRLLRAASLAGAVVTTGAFVAFPLARALSPVPIDPIFLLGAAVAGNVPALLVARGERRGALAAIAGGVVAIVLGAVFTVMPAVQRTRPFVEEVLRAAGDAPLVERDLFDFTTLYYARRRIPTVGKDEAAKTLRSGGFVLASPEAARELSLASGARIAAVTSDRILLAPASR